MAENKTETKIVMLTIKQAAALVEGLTEYRVRQMCLSGQVPHICAERPRKKIVEMARFFWTSAPSCGMMSLAKTRHIYEGGKIYGDYQKKTEWFIRDKSIMRL